ncbi:hypothetical protein EJ08DRAFT_682826 [Tothia fuscella]|uniref:BTB domain-containing protein n=1 Tax=Tothia fuscella TaxID=1048955 RepID=A0A9P4TT91_9PEZI|nr:hypothetical protein EJ08DRAFT_682826 [Tothia fuscella]
MSLKRKLSNLDDKNCTPFFAGLDKMFERGEYTDLVLHCKDGKDIKAHKMVLCVQSGYFANACKPESFSESFNGELNIDFKSRYVEAMLRYCYTFDHQINDVTAADHPHFHATLYVMADYYQIPSLKSIAKSEFEAVVKASDPEFFNTLVYVYENTPPEDDGLRHIVARLCALSMATLICQERFMDVMAIAEAKEDLSKVLEGAISIYDVRMPRL